MHSNELADEFGVKPTFLSLLFRSPSTAYKVFFGPAFPCHYRLLGPGAWNGAWRETHRLYDMIYPPTSTLRKLIKVVLLLAIPVAVVMKSYQYEWLISLADHLKHYRWLQAWSDVFTS